MNTTQTTTWQKVGLGEVVDIIDGDRGNNYPGKNELLKDGYCVFLDAKNVSGTKFDFSSIQFITKQKHNVMRKGQLERRDFVLTTRGTVGNIAYYDEGIPLNCMRINSGMVILRPRHEIITDDFFYSFLISREFRDQVEALKTGSAQPQLPIRDLKLLEIGLPPILHQKRIADILSVFDDKIELNNKISRTLEEMARAIFKEWFVKPLVSGQIPKGWSRKKISDIATLNRGVSYSSADINGSGGKALVNLANFVRGGGFKLDGIKSYTGKFKANNIVRAGQVVIAMTDITQNREIVGHPARIPGSLNGAVISLDVCAIDAKSEYTEFLYFLMLRDSFAAVMASSATGTNVSHLNKNNIENYEFVLPVDSLLEKFNSIVHPLLSQKDNLEMENEKLTALRDLLLSRLMDGGIRV